MRVQFGERMKERRDEKVTRASKEKKKKDQRGFHVTSSLKTLYFALTIC